MVRVSIVTQTWNSQGQGSAWHILGGLRNGRHVSQDLYNQCKGQSIKFAQRNLKQQTFQNFKVTLRFWNHFWTFPDSDVDALH